MIDKNYPYLRQESNPIGTFLRNPGPIWIGARHVNHSLRNIMAYDLGLPPSSFDDDDAIESHIGLIDRQFRLIMITEYMDESLILLKRYMCWEMKDILYVSLKADSTEADYGPPTSDDEKVHRKWSKADYMFYDYFNATFWRKVEKQDTGFWDEVRTLQYLTKILSELCQRITKYDEYPILPATHYNEQILITEYKCSVFRSQNPTNQFRNKEFASYLRTYRKQK